MRGINKQLFLQRSSGYERHSAELKTAIAAARYLAEFKTALVNLSNKLDIRATLIGEAV
jgi:hypothetical protein